MKSLFLCALLSLGFCLGVAQRSPRTDDHLFRHRVVMRIDLREKVNKPMVDKEGKQYISADSRFQYTEGMVKALVDGWREGKYPAFRADTLHAKFEYAQFIERLKKLMGTPAAGTAGAGSTTDVGTDDGGFGDDFGDEGDDFGGEDEFGGDDFGGDATGTGAIAGTGDVAATSGQTELNNLEYIMEVIEDRIFDKGRGDMVYDIKYLVLKFVDPDGVVDDENLVAFAYNDPEVQEQMNQTQWKNRFNDAENRSIRQILDLRLFNSTILSVGNGKPVNDLQEAERRKQQLIEAEHHLWSY